MLGFARIPPDLKAIPRWVIWRRLDGSKVPTRPDSIDAVSAHNPANWMTFDAALRALCRTEPGWQAITGHGGGLGFMPSAADDVVFIDLDKCRDPVSGAVASWALEALVLFGDAYVEVSPSQKGLRILCRGPAKPARAKFQSKVEVSVDDLTVAGKEAYVEMYSFGQFCTVTGQHYSGRSELVDCSDAWDALMVQYGGQDSARRKGPKRHYGEVDLAVVADALRHFSSDDVDRGTFIGIGAVVKQQFGEEGFEVWADWMDKSLSNDPEATEAMWASMSGKAHSMTLGTVFWLARKRGWAPERPPKLAELIDAGAEPIPEDQIYAD